MGGGSVVMQMRGKSQKAVNSLHKWVCTMSAQSLGRLALMGEMEDVTILDLNS